jgi:YesN/AraC family two-component response regulator
MSQNNSIETFDKRLKEIAFDMNVLLVEDDTILQSQIKLFLARFFGRVDTADNGEEAFKKYEQKSYDVVVTDLTMPYLDGLELSKRIKNRNATQKIIIMSAHSESEKLIALINLGVDGFLLKPINVQHMMQQLGNVCHALYDQKMLQYFRAILEETNKELKESNTALEKALNEISYCKVHRHHTAINTFNDILPEADAKNFYAHYNSFDLDQSNKTLEDLEYAFNLLLLNIEHNIAQETLSELLRIVTNYITIMQSFNEFQILTRTMQNLQDYLRSLHTLQNFSHLLPLLTTLFDDLENWRKGLFEYKNVTDIYFMNSSIIEKINTITQ